MTFNKTSTMKLAVILSAVGMMSGCSDKESADVTPALPAPPANNQVNLGTETAPATPPANTPPPDASAVAAAAAQPMVNEAEAAAKDAKVEFKDLDGKTISVIEWLEQMISGYERLRASDVENVRQPIKTVEDLVTYRMIQRIPAAPAGKKYSYDPQTGKVSVVSQ